MKHYIFGFTTKACIFFFYEQVITLWLLNASRLQDLIFCANHTILMTIGWWRLLMNCPVSAKKLNFSVKNAFSSLYYKTNKRKIPLVQCTNPSLVTQLMISSRVFEQSGISNLRHYKNAVAPFGLGKFPILWHLWQTLPDFRGRVITPIPPPNIRYWPL